MKINSECQVQGVVLKREGNMRRKRNQILSDRLRVNVAGPRRAGQDFFKARRKNIIIHTSTMVIGWRSANVKNDSVSEGRNDVGMT